MRTKRALKHDLNANPLLWLASVPEKHVQVYVFAPRTREAKIPWFVVTILMVDVISAPLITRDCDTQALITWQNVKNT